MGAVASFEASHDILGIPHHLAMVYGIPGQEWLPSRTTRLRRCAVFQLETLPNLFEDTRLREAADCAALRSGYIGPLEQAWSMWHARAEGVCNAAVDLLLAVRLSKPARPKGFTPTSRAVAERARDGSQDSIALRRIKHQKRRGAPLSVVQVRQWRAFVQDKVAKAL